MAELVCLAVAADLDEMEAALVDAFADDPVMAWMYPDADTRPAKSARFLRTMLDVGFPHGHVYAVGPHNDAVAVWCPPDVRLFDEVAGEALWSMLQETLGERAVQVATQLMQVAEARPTDRGPNFYLAELGTRRSAQSSGLGSLLMREVLERCDRQGLGAYLESSNIRNVPFYERHGFQVLSEIAVSDDCLLRPMWRDPQ